MYYFVLFFERNVDLFITVLEGWSPSIKIEFQGILYSHLSDEMTKLKSYQQLIIGISSSKLYQKERTNERKLIQALIQMDRPQNWNSSHIINLIREIIAIEKYNSKSPSSIVKYERKWRDIENKINEMNLI
jgi:hypothetical protein